MRIEILSGRVYETDSPQALLQRLHDSSQFREQPFRSYLEGFVQRLRPLRIAGGKTWLQVPDAVATGSDDGYAKWLAGELLRLGRWKETEAPTEEEKEAKAQAAAEAKKKAAAAKAAAAKEAAAKEAAAKEAPTAAAAGSEGTPADVSSRAGIAANATPDGDTESS